MFAALLVGRSLRAPKAASALAALSTRGAGSGFGSNSEGFTAGSWSLFTHLGSANNDKEREKRPALPKHVATLVQAPGMSPPHLCSLSKLAGH